MQSTENVEACIIEPLKILMKGVDPEIIEIPFSPNALKFAVNGDADQPFFL